MTREHLASGRRKGRGHGSRESKRIHLRSSTLRVYIALREAGFSAIIFFLADRAGPWRLHRPFAWGD